MCLASFFAVRREVARILAKITVFVTHVYVFRNNTKYNVGIKSEYLVIYTQVK